MIEPRPRPLKVIVTQRVSSLEVALRVLQDLVFDRRFTDQSAWHMNHSQLLVVARPINP